MLFCLSFPDFPLSDVLSSVLSIFHFTSKSKRTSLISNNRLHTFIFEPTKTLRALHNKLVSSKVTNGKTIMRGIAEFSDVYCKPTDTVTKTPTTMSEKLLKNKSEPANKNRRLEYCAEWHEI